MKKLLLILTILSVSVLSSCVDDAYDLNNISDKEITVGGDLPIPLTTINILLEDLFDFSPITPLPPPRATISVPVPPSFDDTFTFKAGFDIADYIGESGETILKGNITSPFLFPVKLSVTLKNGDTESVVLIVDQVVSPAPVITQITPVTLTKKQIDFLSKADAIHVQFNTASGQSETADLDPQQSVKIFLSLLKKGGIKI